MLLHDPSDIFLETAKLCDLAGWELAATVLFALLLTTWGFMRLVVLPFWIIYSMLCALTACDHLLPAVCCACELSG